MMRIRAITTLLGVLASPPALVAAQPPSLSGEWILAPESRSSGTVSGAAFNCGRQCRVVQKGSTLTIDNAHFAPRGTSFPGSPPRPARAATPAVTLRLDGQAQAVDDSYNIGNTIDTVSQWKDGKLLITSSIDGRLAFTQTVSLDQNVMVVTTSSEWTTTFRYTKK